MCFSHVCSNRPRLKALVYLFAPRLTTQISRFPFQFRFEALNGHLRNSAAVRRWFAQNVVLSPPTRMSEYILLAPSQEVRMVFVKLVTVCCLFAGNDEPISGYDGDNLCEQILKCALALLKNDVAEHGKHLGQYFTLFSLYAASGAAQKQQLLKVRSIAWDCGEFFLNFLSSSLCS